jgi:hypothetical protein
MLASFQVISPLALERDGVNREGGQRCIWGAKASGATKSGTAGASGPTALKGTLVHYVGRANIRETHQILSNKCLTSDCRNYLFNLQFSVPFPI